MKKSSKQVISMLLSITMLMLSLVVASINAEIKGSRMTFKVSSATASPGSDVLVSITAKSPVALTSLEDVSLVVSGDSITPVSIESKAGGTVNYSVSGNKLTFSFSGASKMSAGGTVFVAKFHVNDNCPITYYKVTWETNDTLGHLSDGSPYFPMFDYGYINVTSGSQPVVITTIATTTTTSTTTTTTTTSTTTTTTTTKPVTTSTTTTVQHSDTTDDYLLGDIDCSGAVDGSDATIALKEYSVVGSGKASTLSSAQRLAGDVDQNSSVDGSDATLILKYYALTGAGLKPDWDSIRK